jgi:cyclophilin family peptidyl-prolyl cis-trans isomerase
MTRSRLAALAVLIAGALAGALAGAQNPPAAPPPIIVVETSKGTFAFETFPDQAPATVAHITALVRARFYDGQRVHRVLPGLVVQFGDPQSRDETLRERWGRGPGAASGKAVGVAEVSPKRLHRRGAVGLAHAGNPADGDSQIYVTLARRTDLDGRYAVFGQVISGEDVPAALQVGDTITRVVIREP